MAENRLSILFPWQDRVTYQPLAQETWHNLGLDAIVSKVAQTPQEIPLLERVMTSLTADPGVARFRSDVFEDLLNYPEIRTRMTELLEKVKMFYDYGVVNRKAGDEAGVWDLMHRLEEYHDYILTVEEIRKCLDQKELRSEGLKQLKTSLDSTYESQGFAALKKDVEELRVSASGIRSLTVGINVNDRFEAVSMGLVSVNARPFTRSGMLKHFASAALLRDNIQPEADWNGSLSYEPAVPLGSSLTAESLVQTTMMMRNPLVGMTLASIPRDDASSEAPRQMDHAASQLVTRLVRKLKDVLARHMNISVREIADLIPELLFYVRWAEYLETLREKGWIFRKPQVLDRAAESKDMEAKGFYNLKLIGAIRPEQAVLNDLVFDVRKRVYLLTGANRGGKTTLTQAVGQLFLMAQSGIFVPAEAFSYVPVDQVLTHFPADEDKTLDLGRLGEECRRFREIYSASTEQSLILLNETFSTTSFEEGYFIAADALRAILKKGVRTIFNTHMHKLAQELDTVINRPEVPAQAVSLVAETREGENTFRIRIAPPEGKSFARTIAEKYGVTYEKLTGEPPAEEET